MAQLIEEDVPGIFWKGTPQKNEEIECVWFYTVLYGFYTLLYDVL